MSSRWNVVWGWTGKGFSERPGHRRGHASGQCHRCSQWFMHAWGFTRRRGPNLLGFPLHRRALPGSRWPAATAGPHNPQPRRQQNRRGRAPRQGHLPPGGAGRGASPPRAPRCGARCGPLPLPRPAGRARRGHRPMGTPPPPTRCGGHDSARTRVPPPAAPPIAGVANQRCVWFLRTKSASASGLQR